MRLLARWFDSLFARILLLQAAMVAMVLLLFSAFFVWPQSQALARASAPLWAAALKPVIEGREGLPLDQQVRASLRLVPGPPPADAAQFPFLQRLRALAVELRAAGVPVQTMKLSGTTGDAVTWVGIDRGAGLEWIGIESGLEGADMQRRGGVGLLLGMAGALGLAGWLSRRVLRPVTELRAAMRRFKDDGQPPGAAAASAPLELRELSQQFDTLARDVQALEAQRRTMLAAISHDLRSPLGRIRLAAELLPEAEGVAARREAIVRNVGVADRLLGSFIDLARAEDEPIAGRVDIATLVREGVREGASDGVREGAAADGDGDGDGDIVALALPAHPLWLQPASAAALERTLRNLLDNARHHGRAPIEVTLESRGPWAVLGVRDHGGGIAAGDREAMLQPFARGQASRQTPGTGLGLAIVQRTALRHGGQLRLGDAAPGLRAELWLPLAAEP